MKIGVATGEAGARRCPTREVLRREHMLEAADALDERLFVVGFTASKEEAVEQPRALLVGCETSSEVTGPLQRVTERVVHIHPLRRLQAGRGEQIAHGGDIGVGQGSALEVGEAKIALAHGG